MKKFYTQQAIVIGLVAYRVSLLTHKGELHIFHFTKELELTDFTCYSSIEDTGVEDDEWKKYDWNVLKKFNFSLMRFGFRAVTNEIKT